MSIKNSKTKKGKSKEGEILYNKLVKEKREDIIKIALAEFGKGKMPVEVIEEGLIKDPLKITKEFFKEISTYYRKKKGEEKTRGLEKAKRIAKEMKVRASRENEEIRKLYDGYTTALDLGTLKTRIALLNIELEIEENALNKGKAFTIPYVEYFRRVFYTLPEKNFEIIGSVLNYIEANSKNNIRGVEKEKNKIRTLIKQVEEIVKSPVIRVQEEEIRKKEKELENRRAHLYQMIYHYEYIKTLFKPVDR